MEHPALGSLLKFLIASRQSHLGSQVCPRWDPTWDYGTSRLKFLIASHLRRHIPGEIKPRIPPIPLGILPQISDSSYPISLFEAVNMTLKLLIVPSFNSTAPTTFFSFTTLTLFSFSHWSTKNPIFRSVILSRTVEKRNNLKQERLIDEKYIQRWAPNRVFFTVNGLNPGVTCNSVVWSSGWVESWKGLCR